MRTTRSCRTTSLIGGLSRWPPRAATYSGSLLGGSGGGFWSRTLDTRRTDSGGHPHSQHPGRYVLCDHGTGPGPGSVAQLHWRHQHRVGAQEDAFADLGLVLPRSVVVAGNRARTDIGALTQLGVADVAEVMLLHARVDPAGLDLCEVADLRLSPDRRPGSQMRHRPIWTSSSTSEHSRMLAQTRQSRPTMESMIWLPAPMRVPSPILVVPRRMTPGSRTTSGASSTVVSTYVRAGSTMVTPASMWRSLMTIRNTSSAAASCDRSLMPATVPSSSTSSETTGLRSSWASVTSSGR